MNDGRANAGPDTKTRILDAAEHAFATQGFDGASLRAITSEAGVNLAAVNYHFQSKEALFAAVVARRIDPINERRLEMLDAAGENPSVHAILEAFLRPPLDVTEGFRSEVIRPLLGRMYSTPGDLAVRIIKNQFAPMLNRFTDALHAAVPKRTPEELKARMLFLVGAMSHVMAWGPTFTAFTGAEGDGRDINWVLQQLVEFAAAGIEAE